MMSSKSGPFQSKQIGWFTEAIFQVSAFGALAGRDFVTETAPNHATHADSCNLKQIGAHGRATLRCFRLHEHLMMEAAS